MGKGSGSPGVGLGVAGLESVAALAASLPAKAARVAGARGAVLLVADEPGDDLVPRGVGAADGRQPPPSPGGADTYPPLPAGHPLARWLARRRVAFATGRGGEPTAARAWLAGRGVDAAVALEGPGERLAGALLFTRGRRALGRAVLARVAEEATVRLEAARLREQLDAARGGIERGERLVALGALTAALAHELKNPLVAIRTFAQLLPDRYDDPDFRGRFAAIALGEIDRASTLLGELLEFARAPQAVESGPPARPRSVEDVNAILVQMLTLAEAEARGRRIRLAQRLDPSLPRVPVDRDRMKQLFLNLLLNAMQSIDGDGGEVVVETTARHEPEGAFVAIDVRDTGAGIAPADLPSLFTPFFSRKPAGIGLGLAVCRDIVHAHRGHIEIHSEPGRGTVVRVRLPVRGVA